MSTLANFNVSITAPKSVIPDITKVGKTPEVLQRIANFFEACAGSEHPGQPGETRISIHKGSTDAAAAKAYETVVLASCAAGTVFDLNGALFTAVSGTPTAGNNEFDISGADAADATSFAAAVNASASVGVSGDIEANNLQGVVTLTSAVVGKKLTIGTRSFTSTAYPTGRVGEFSVAGTDAQDATALAAAINADPSTNLQVVATVASNVVTVLQRTKSTTALAMTSNDASIALTGLSSGALAASATVLLSAKVRGTLGNAVRVATTGIVALGSVAYSSSSGAQTVVINGVTVYNATGASDAANAIAAAAAINASTDPLVQPFVRALVRTSTVYIYSKKTGLTGNTITLSATGTGATASGARLTGGTIASSAGAQATGTLTIASGSGSVGGSINGVSITVTWGTSDAASATALAAAINASTNALIQGVVYATVASGVVTVNAVKGGVDGNAITLVASGTGVTASGARLTGGAAATTITPSAEHLSGGVGGDDISPTLYQF